MKRLRNLQKRLAWMSRYYRRHPGLIGLLLLFTALSSAAAVSFPLVFKYVIDSFTTRLSAGEDSDGERLLWNVVGILAVIGLVRAAAAFYPGFRAIINFKFENDVRGDVFGRLLAKGARFFMRFRTGDLVTRLTDDISDYPKIAWFMGSGVFRALDSVAKFAFCFAVMCVLNWRLALLSAVPLPLMFFVFWRLQGRLGERWRTFREEVSKTNDAIEAAFAGIRIVKAYRAEANLTERFRRDLNKRVDVEVSLTLLSSVFGFVHESAGVFGQMVVIVAGGYMVVQNPPLMGLGDFFAFYVYLGMLLQPLLDIPNLFLSAKQSFVLMDREDEICNFERQHEVSAEAMRGKIAIAGIDCVEFRNVTFRYEPELPPVLTDISFVLRRGEKMALVGEVGCGKTTLLKLMLGQLLPNSGQILVNGRDLREVDLASYWKCVGYTPQEAFIFNDSVAANVLLMEGAVSAVPHEMGGTETILSEASQQKLRETLARVNLLDEVARWPQGVHTRVGLRAAAISGGQAQRLSMARAFLRDADCFVMDDCFSALDAENERIVWREMERRIDQCMCVLATHRLSSLAHFDQVLVLHDGRIAQRGAPHDLALEDGPYRNLIFALVDKTRHAHQGADAGFAVRA